MFCAHASEPTHHHVERMEPWQSCNKLGSRVTIAIMERFFRITANTTMTTDRCQQIRRNMNELDTTVALQSYNTISFSGLQ